MQCRSKCRSRARPHRPLPSFSEAQRPLGFPLARFSPCTSNGRFEPFPVNAIGSRHLNWASLSAAADSAHDEKRSSTGRAKGTLRRPCCGIVCQGLTLCRFDCEARRFLFDAPVEVQYATA
jgi:hypothetical protein